MNPDWQTWAAAGVVVATLAVFAARIFKKKRGGNCSSCGGSSKTPSNP